MPSIPGEITDIIIDHLHNDHPTLRSCSLTCRDWVASSRSHLFRVITLERAGDARRLQQLMTTSPGLAQYVRQLVISDPNVDSSWMAEILHLRPCFEQLEGLLLHRVNFLVPSTRNYFLLDAFTLTTLTIQECTIPANYLIRLLCTNTRLRNANILSNTIVQPVSNDAERRIGESCPLTSLRIRSFLGRYIKDAFSAIRTIDLPKIHHLSIPIMPIVIDIGDASQLLHSVGPSLRSLHLSISCPSIVVDSLVADIGTNPFFSHLPLLQTLKLSFPPEIRSNTLPLLLSRILSQVHSSSLKELIIAARYRSHYSQWNDLDRVLTSPSFDGLRKFVLNLYFPPPASIGEMNNVALAVRMGLSKVESRGILDFHVYQSSRIRS
ncbi:hypothetical protein JAAARDRAFT_205736 [Jaapia argillacea MUCL 33604]|uniref:F-box domain-containing protein n=1 Tax=Jaapia argillacea MUCL 33604 TaxID=933084 RepID=A0A067QB02_9AGAM|nr:hypothetical protein JAAARDRAFT_205736 [Jaapia argillacea MUCL 33604]